MNTTPRRPKQIFDRRSVFFSIIVLAMFGAVLYLLFALNQNVQTKKSGSSTDYELYRNLGSKLKSEKMFEQAITAYNTYLSDPALTPETRANIHYTIGNLYFELHQYDKALAAYYAADMLGVPPQIAGEVNIKIVNSLERLGRDFSAEYALKSRTSLDEDTKKEQPSGQIVAQYGSEYVTMRDLDEQLEMLDETQRQQFRDPQQKFMFLQQYIAQKLLARKAVKMGYDKDTEILNKLDMLKDQLMVEKMVKAEIEGKISIDPEDVKNFYEARKSAYREPDSFRIAHIQVPTKDKADSVLASLSGGADFAAAAQSESQAADASTGGTIDAWLSTANPVYKGTDYTSIIQAIQNLETGGLSQAIEHGGTYHIVKVLDKKPGAQLTFEQAAQKVAQDYQISKAQKIYQSMMENILKVEGVKINQEAFFPEQKSGDDKKIDIKQITP
ncbi:MAG: peptidyl-prolyl cis-trans isomerase [Candidatus Auribacterota bacterium]